jgi:hypothetical protein
MARFALLVLASLAAMASAFVPAPSASSWVARNSRHAARVPPRAMMSMDITEKLKEIVAEQLGVEEAAITGEANFAADLGADSLDVVRCARACGAGGGGRG